VAAGQENGIEGLANFGREGGACRLTAEQQDKVLDRCDPAPHRREVGAWIARECAMNTRPGRS
jgi:hypothetical protein